MPGELKRDRGGVARARLLATGAPCDSRLVDRGRRAVIRTRRNRSTPLAGAADRQPGSGNCSRARRGDDMNENIAARAGRWSAGHWKTAVSAWLAFCVVAVALGSVAGTRLLKEADTAAGGSKNGRADPAAGRFPGPRRRERARGVEDADARRPGVPRHRRRRRAHGLAACRRCSACARRSMPANAGQVSQDQPLGARAVRDPRRRGQGRQEGPADPRTPSTASSSGITRLHRRRVRLRERDARVERHDEQRLPAGRVLLAAR